VAIFIAVARPRADGGLRERSESCWVRIITGPGMAEQRVRGWKPPPARLVERSTLSVSLYATPSPAGRRVRPPGVRLDRLPGCLDRAGATAGPPQAKSPSLHRPDHRPDEHRHHLRSPRRQRP